MESHPIMKLSASRKYTLLTAVRSLLINLRILPAWADILFLFWHYGLCKKIAKWLRYAWQWISSSITVSYLYEVFPKMLDYLRLHTTMATRKDLMAWETTDKNFKKDLKFHQRSGTLFHVHNHRILAISFVYPLKSEFWHHEPIAMTIRVLGRNTKVIEDFIKHVEQEWRTENERNTKFFRQNKDNPSEWKFRTVIEKRGFDTVFLGGDCQAQIQSDLDRYWDPATHNEYKLRGQPLRRGYLFEGPPGTGKTSLAAAIAGHWDLDVYVLSLQEGAMTDACLLELFERVPAKTVILIEDIDCLGISRDNNITKDAKPLITLSGLLNAIDGLTSPQGHLLIMTTNEPDQLDKALMRPGRVDRRFHLGKCDTQQAIRIFSNVFAHTGVSLDQIEVLAQHFVEDTVSPAELLNLLARQTADEYLSEIKAKATNQSDSKM